MWWRMFLHSARSKRFLKGNSAILWQVKNVVPSRTRFAIFMVWLEEAAPEVVCPRPRQRSDTRPGNRPWVLLLRDIGRKEFQEPARGMLAGLCDRHWYLPAWSARSTS